MEIPVNQMPIWVEAQFLKRLNRFSAEVLITGSLAPVVVHVANTARLKELLIPGVAVLLTHEPKESRKTQHTLRRVAMGNIWVSIDSNAPNRSLRHWLEKGDWRMPGIDENPVVKSEVIWGQSRFDLMLPEHNLMIEVKGVTLVRQGWAMFPDAPTTRGTKHVNELRDFASKGGRAAIVFICQRQDVERFKPYAENDPEFSKALIAANAAGVEIYVLRTRVTLQGDVFDGEIPWSLT